MKIRHTRFAMTLLEEVRAVSEYLTHLETYLPAILQTEKECIWASLDPDDDDDHSIGTYLEDQVDRGLTTRLVNGTALIAVCAAYETVVAKCAEQLREAKGLQRKMPVRGGSFLDLARKYFKDELRFELHRAGTDYNRLSMIATLRHAFAHGNGLVAQLRYKEDRAKVLRWTSGSSPLKLDGGCLIVPLKFIRDAWDFTHPLLTDLIERVDAETRGR